MPNDGLTLWGFFPCRTDALDAVKKLNEWTSAGRTSSSAKQFLKEISKKSFAWAKDRFFYKLVNELRVNPDTYGRAKKKKLRIQKCPDTGGRDLKDPKISIPRCDFVPFHVALRNYKYP